MKKSFVSPSFWELFSLGIEFLDNSSFSTLKMLFHYLFASIILKRNLLTCLSLLLCALPNSLLHPRCLLFSSVQFSSVTQSCPTLWHSLNLSTPGSPVHHQLPEFTHTHVHCVGDAIQPSHPPLSPSPAAPNLSQHQGLFKWVSSSYPVANVLEFQLQPQSFQWTPRTDLL